MNCKPDYEAIDHCVCDETHDPLRSAVNQLVSNFAKILRRQFQCRFGVHWVSISNIAEAHDCPDCGKHFSAIKWPRRAPKKVD